MKQIENMCAEEMKKEIREGFTKIKENNADVLGVGNYFYRFDFTDETPAQMAEIVKSYETGRKSNEFFTRGHFYNEIKKKIF